MAITKKDIYMMLSNEEPDYPAIAKKLNKSNLNDLRSLASSNNNMIATKAIYLASLIDEDDSSAIVDAASKSRSELKKIAAASALQNLKVAAKYDAIASRLLNSRNAGIKKMALLALSKKGTKSLSVKRKLERVSRLEKSSRLKSLSKAALHKSK
jgi:hypothetical protein